MKVTIGVLVLAVVILGGALTYTLINRQSSTEGLVDPDSVVWPDESSGENIDKESIVNKGDGAFVTYIKDAYSKDGKNYLVLDYVQYLTGADAIRKRIETGKSCQVPSGVSKEDFINSYPSVYDGQLTDLRENWYLGCEFPNGMWMYANDNPQLRTFVASDKIGIYLTHVYVPMYEESCGNLIKQVGDKYEAEFSALTVCKSLKYPPYDVVIHGEEVVQLSERYVP